MDPNEDMCKSLVKWLQVLVPDKTRNVSEICDGVGMLDALLQISPEHFTKLESKIKREVGLNNWRLRISNLKKIVEAIVDYYHVALTLQILDIGRPDVVRIGESNDLVELAKLLRLILGNVNTFNIKFYDQQTHAGLDILIIVIIILILV